MYPNGQLATSYYRVERGYEQRENRNFDKRGTPGMGGASKRISASVVSGLLLPFDVAVLAAGALLAFALHLTDDPYADWTSYGLVVGFGVLLAVNIFQMSGLYDAKILQRPKQTYQRVIVGWFAVAATLITISFFAKTSDDYSRIWAMLWFGFGLMGLLGLRAIFFARAARWAATGRLQNNLAILGTGPFAARLAQYFAANAASGIQVAGMFSENNRIPKGERAVRAQTIEDLIARVRRDHIDTVVIAIPKLTRRRLHHIMESLRDVPVDVRVCPNSLTLDLTSNSISHVAGLPLLNAIDRPLTNWRSATKEIEDRILASIILVLISPVLLAIAALIKIDSPGPALFRQKRYGYNNQLITVFKFRTMRIDQQDDAAGQLTQRNDPRITRIGAFLRRTSLDELPQFLNVLRGEMSIVGPRPHAISAKAGGVLYHDAVSHYAARHRVKPGITGWAQINGWRGTTDTVDQIEKRVEHDLYYIEHWSLWLDLKIIALTIFKGFSGQNAY